MVGKPFKPGQSGNPGGRPKIIGDLKLLAREHTNEAVKTLVEVMKSVKAPPAARAFAANSLLDRGYGKPTQHVEANVNLLDGLNFDDRAIVERVLEAVVASREGPSGGSSTATH